MSQDLSQEKVRILPVQKRPVPRDGSRVLRLPTDLLFLAGLAIAFVLAHYSDKPPLVEKPITIQRTDGPLVAESNMSGVSVLDTGLRGFER